MKFYWKLVYILGMNKSARERPSTVKIDQVKDSDVDPTTQLSSVDNEDLNYAYSQLTPQQIQAARFESFGISDRQLIANKVGVSPATISGWRKNDYYKKVIKVNVTIIENYGRKFRADVARQIIAPVYMELASRTNDPTQLIKMNTKDLLEILTKMTKEIRLDTIIASDNEGENDLVDLQRRRNALIADQAKAIEDLKEDGKIIQMPRAENG